MVELFHVALTSISQKVSIKLPKDKYSAEGMYDFNSLKYEGPNSLLICVMVFNKVFDFLSIKKLIKVTIPVKGILFTCQIKYKVKVIIC